MIDDCVLERGDFAIVAPPDIQLQRCATRRMRSPSVNGAYKPDRHYYQPDEKTYVVRPQRNAR